MKIRKRGIIKKTWIEISAESGSWGELDFGEGQYAKSASRFWKKGRILLRLEIVQGLHGHVSK